MKYIELIEVTRTSVRSVAIRKDLVLQILEYNHDCRKAPLEEANAVIEIALDTVHNHYQTNKPLVRSSRMIYVNETYYEVLAKLK